MGSDRMNPRYHGHVATIGEAHCSPKPSQTPSHNDYIVLYDLGHLLGGSQVKRDQQDGGYPSQKGRRPEEELLFADSQIVEDGL